MGPEPEGNQFSSASHREEKKKGPLNRASDTSRHIQHTNAFFLQCQLPHLPHRPQRQPLSVPGYPLQPSSIQWATSISGANLTAHTKNQKIGPEGNRCRSRALDRESGFPKFCGPGVLCSLFLDMGEADSADAGGSVQNFSCRNGGCRRNSRGLICPVSYFKQDQIGY
jgi:hypothetical protein